MVEKYYYWILLLIIFFLVACQPLTSPWWTHLLHFLEFRSVFKSSSVFEEIGSWNGCSKSSKMGSIHSIYRSIHWYTWWILLYMSKNRNKGVWKLNWTVYLYYTAPRYINGADILVVYTDIQLVYTKTGMIESPKISSLGPMGSNRPKRPTLFSSSLYYLMEK